MVLFLALSVASAKLKPYLEGNECWRRECTSASKASERSAGTDTDDVGSSPYTNIFKKPGMVMHSSVSTGGQHSRISETVTETMGEPLLSKAEGENTLKSSL